MEHQAEIHQCSRKMRLQFQDVLVVHGRCPKVTTALSFLSAFEETRHPGIGLCRLTLTEFACLGIHLRGGGGTEPRCPGRVQDRSQQEKPNPGSCRKKPKAHSSDPLPLPRSRFANLLSAVFDLQSCALR